MIGIKKKVSIQPMFKKNLVFKFTIYKSDTKEINNVD